MRNLFIEQSLKYLITVLITFSVKIQSQNLQSISPFTPEMSNLVKRVDIPLNYSSGALNYSLNLYTLKLRNLELPITLNYASTGFKPDVNSSNIGLGWDIEVGGKISHTIKGLDDLQYPNESAYFPEGEFPVDRPLKMNYFEPEFQLNPYSIYSHPEYSFLTSDPNSNLSPGSTFRPHWGINADTQPDIFYYSFPGKSGKFFLDKTKTGRQMPMGKEQISYEVGKFKIIDTSGNIYEYATKDLILMDSGSIIISGAYPTGNTSTNYSNFYLSKIYSQNDVVEFVYENVEYAYDNPTSYTKGVIENGGIAPKDYTPTYEIRNVSVVSKHTLPILKAIKVNDKQRISFNYNTPPRKDVKNIYEKKISPLSEIVVKENNNFYNIKLEQTYFLSALTNLPSYNTSWLKLNTVTINDTKYSFEYYEDGVLPTKDTESKDFWGYYSLNAGSRYSKKDFKNYFYLQNRRPDKEATKLTTLKKIIYPTKGEDSFSYESNTYNEANYKEYHIDQKQASVIYNNEFLNNQQIFEEQKQFTIGTAINNEKVTLTYDIPFISGGATTTHFINYSLKNETANSYESFPALSGYGSIEMYLAPGTYTLSMKAAGLDSDAFLKFDWEEITLTSQGQKNLEVGGLRLSEITTKDHTGNALLKKQITYNDNNISTGTLYDYPIFLETERVGHMALLDQCNLESFSAGYKKYNSTSLADILGFNGNPVYYSKVQEKIMDSNNIDKGKVVYYFSIFNDSPLYYNKYYLTYNDNSWKRGLLTKQEFYKKNEFLPFKTIDIRYKILETPQTNLGESGIGYTAPSQPNELHRMSYEFFIDSPHYVRLCYAGVEFHFANFDFIGKKLVSAWVYKDQETTTENINNKILKTTTDYVYSNPVNAQLSKTITTFPDNSLQETTYQYAHDKNKTKLIEANMVGIPLETTVVKKQNASDPGKTISKTYTDYPDTLPDTQTGNLLLPKSVSALDLVTGGMSTEVTYNQYDNKGNILQYTTKTGVPTAIIWDKSQTQPIAKVEGATYAQASAVAGDIVTASDQSLVGYTEANLLSKLDAFRNSSALAGFQITTYTYKPLIGVSSITPPSGIREVYIYDTANRLQEVRDVNGNLLKSYEYHYKP